MMAWSFGRRASNSSATRGRPPVMSRVLALSIGIRASTSPAFTSAPGSTERTVSTGRQVTGLGAAAAALPRLLVLALDDDRRLQVAAARVGPPVDDDALGDAGRLVGRFRHRQTIDEVLVADDAVDFRDDRPRVGIPLGDALAALHLVAFIDEHPRAEGHAVGRALGAVTIDDDELHVAAIAMLRPSESLTMLRLRISILPSKLDSSVD